MPPQSTVAPRRRSLDTITIWVFFTTIIAALLVFVPATTASSATTKTYVLAAGAIITLALYILARLSRGNVIFPPSALIGALWLPVVAYALSAIFSNAPFTNSLWGKALETDTLGFMLVVAILGTLSALVLRRSEQYHSFLRAGGWVFGIIVVLQFLIVILGQFASNTISPEFSLIGSYSDLATFLGLGIVSILITLRCIEPSQRTHRRLIASGVVALLLLAIANVSLIWILLALVSLGLFVEAVMLRGSKSVDVDLDEAVMLDETPLGTDDGNHSLVLPLVVLAVSLFFLIGGTLGGALANALHVNIVDVRPSWQSTFTITQKTYAVSPIFGSGPGTFGIEWLKYRDASLNSTIFWNVDFTSGIGFIPTSAVTTGMVGVIAWLLFIGLFIVLGLRMLIRRAPQDPFIRSVAIVSFVGSVYLLSTALFNLPSAVILALAFVFVGLFVSTMRFAVDSQQRGVLFARSPRLGFIIVFAFTILLLVSVVVAYSLVGRYIATTELTRSLSAFSAGDLDGAEKATQNSISFAPSVAAYQVQAGIANARLNNIVASSTMDKAMAQQAYQTALSAGINAALTATNLQPSDYQSWLSLGNLYAQAVPLGVSGAYESAKTAYQKAQLLNPTNPQISYILAQLDIAHKDTKAAQEHLKAAITLKQDYTAAIFLLSQLLVADGNVKDALTSALAAAYFQPNDPNILFQVGILYAAQSDLLNAAAALSAAVTANPSFANARYFLSAVYARLGDFSKALEQMQAIAALSPENAEAVKTYIADLETKKNPFPENLLSVSPAPVN